MPATPDNYWRHKLTAYLHDSPDKPADILTHELRAKQFRALFGLDAGGFNKTADFDAAAADRLPFPASSIVRQELADLTHFPHPLGRVSMEFESFKTPAQAEEVAAKTMPFVLGSEDPRAIFICAWRFWRNWASHVDSRFAFLPADTRIPDHTIWNHLAVTTAFQGSLPGTGSYGIEDAPRLLLFSLGPVQEFIAAARSTRDLWSGSYLLSYLVSKILGDIALEFGPDHVLFPNLLDQPLIDLRLREAIFDKHRFAKNTIWEGFDYSGKQLPRLLTPSLPNRFMALLPARDHEGNPIDEWIRSRIEDLRDELGDVARSVSGYLAEHGVESVACADFDRFDRQVARMIEAHWQTVPVPSRLEELQEWLELLPPDTGEYSPRKAFRAIEAMIGQLKDQDVGPEHDLRTTSNWAGLNALLSFLHDGAKAARIFDAWRGGRWDSGKEFNKDALNGREEAVLEVTAPKDQVERFCKKLEMSKGTLRQGELLGASTLIKRFWWQTWLIKERILGVRADQMRKAHPMPNTRCVAAGRPFDSENEQDEPAGQDEKYFAILALDGDEMGKWISGSKSPPNGHCLSPEAKEFFRKHAPDVLEKPRALTPSWHLQFSEALGTFSFHAAQRIVEAFDGRLIYAGGDDVLAMLPAKDALRCARALRGAFRGETALNELAKGSFTGNDKNRRSDRRTALFSIKQQGYLQLTSNASENRGEFAKLLSDPVDFQALVPGPAADVSVGIAIAHFKAPLQDVVRAAQAAEKRAKRSPDEGGLGRGALAVSLFKRSGEITEWGCKWSAPGPSDESRADSASFRLLEMLIKELGPGGNLNVRFPHKLEGLLSAYLPASQQTLGDEVFERDFAQVLQLELGHCLSRNEGGRLTEDQATLFVSTWDETAGNPFAVRLQSLINLLRTATWMRRGESALNELQPS